MKNFDNFEKRIKLNESELSFLSEEEEDLLDVGDSIVTHLEDNGINAEHEFRDGALHIEVGGDDYTIKQKGFEFFMSTLHDKEPDVLADKDALISWWASFVPQYKAGKEEYNRDDMVDVDEKLHKK